MKRRRSRLVVGTLLAGVVGAGQLAGGAPAANWSHTAVVRATSGLRVEYPKSWHAFAYGEDNESLVVASFPLSHDWPDFEHKRVPAGGTYIWIFTYGALPAGYATTFPVRPAHFTLTKDEYGFYSCSFKLPGYLLTFRLKGMAVQAMVALGQGAHREDALAVLDRLRISGVAPSLPRA
jgi:hypothetical protein